ncbi:uncharacterized protein SPSK_08613 [Sporothrix schenckii 1099-18]|uniref:C3H1-type domain-containing protein n=2 Tax=Sporothrix schenckii TaxID=29908 RepID=U7PXI3_SPOS1|nr:uncharacterized protein SPSK_08613 [Sporothrix schenckii 1099-18]ERT00313.1 hypothetical protein HMPREF1624_03684 [Sporothrix schenckii ATCC 58251]KJR85222.1 hypothetical protein SPSK_08613 [Sporothrix schenckii 1099-18]
MSSYGYGPPPPPPSSSQASGGYGHQYPSTYQQGPSHSGPSPRGGRGGGYYGGRGGGHAGQGGGSEHHAQPGYGYGSQGPQQYGQQSHYGASTPHSAPASYGGPSQQPPSQQQHQWSHEPSVQHHAPPPQGYYAQHPQHAQHAPQGYSQQPPQGQSPAQHQGSYGQQPPYGPPSGPASSQTPYNHHQYQQPSAPPSQQWSGLGGQNGGYSGHYSGRGRGGGGYHHESRGGGSKAHMMGPPIRIGFENGGSQHGPGAGSPAPVSSGGYQPPPYAAPQGGAPPQPPSGPSGYNGAPYQSYPPTGPGGHGGPVGPPQHYDPYYNNQNNRHHQRGGFHNNSHRGGRGGFTDNKMRYKKHNSTSHAGAPHTTHPHSNNHQKPDAASAGKKKKRKTNTLGLTPGEESDEEEDDEEAKLVELIGPDAPNPVDIAAWIAERRSNFPTKERVKAKLAGNDAGDSKPGDGAKPESAAVASHGAKSVAGLTALERQQQKAEKLRKQLEKVESSIKRKREQQDEGDEMRDVEGNGDGADSDASLDSKLGSDDDAPEAVPIRTETAASVAAAAAAAAAKGVIPPAAKKADPTKHCKYYSTGGTCGKKGKCRFVHDPAVREAALQERERNGGRMTLRQRLVLNDKDQEDLTIVKTLQYLKEKGMMSGASAPLAQTAESGGGTPGPGQSGASSKTQSVAPTSPGKSTTKPESGVASLPAAPSLGKKHQQQQQQQSPPQPAQSDTGAAAGSASSAPTVRYQGWDLSGFGNTGVKSEES